MAPSSYGNFANDLLVGNFGNGEINAFNLTTGAFDGTLQDASGNPIVNQGLWGLSFGNGGLAGSTNTLFLTAGIPGPGMVEDHGLFAELNPTPEPGGMLLVGLSLAVLGSLRKRIF